MTVVIDTNVIVMTLSSRSPYHWILQALIQGDLALAISSEILLEYEEIAQKLFQSELLTRSLLQTIENLPVLRKTNTYFNWQLIKDPDDNKFVDCAVSAGAGIIITHDKHFNTLKKVEFPKLIVMTPEAFKVYFDEIQGNL